MSNQNQTEESLVKPFSPKDSFQLFDAPSAATLQEHANSRWLRTALNLSLAQIAAQGASAEELRGARRFIEVFLKLGEKNTVVGKLPPIKLTSYE